MLSNALEARAIRDTLRNEAIREATKDIDTWRETQRAALIDGLVHDVTTDDPDPESLARILGNLDPRIQTWVDTFRPKVTNAIIKMVSAEPILDHLRPQAQEILENAWDEKRAFITEELQSRTTQFLETQTKALQEEAEEHVRKFKAELDAKTADEIQQLKNKSKTSIQTIKDEEDSRELSLAIRTPKAVKPSPLDISKPKRKKKRATILDLTTPPPGNEASDAPTDMETEADSTPTTPVYRSSAPSPTPFPSAPESVPIDMANPETIPKWARTPSPDDKTPHAPTFVTSAPPAPAPQTPPSELATIMTLLTGMKSELLNHIEQVNARIDQTTGPQTIVDYGVWNSENLSAWEHPGYTDPAHDEDMQTLADANAAREVDRLTAE